MGLKVVLLLLMASSCMARDFYVGGRDGWVLKPSEPFTHWAERNRFQVNDRIVFKYRKEEDSVLVVSQSHYDTCNTTDPYLRLDGGDSVFVLGHPGPFFFISGDQIRCESGERLVVVVMAVRQKNKTPVPPSPPTPTPVPVPPSSPPPPAPANSSSPSVSPAQPTPTPTPTPAALPPAGTNGTSSPPSSSATSISRSGALGYWIGMVGPVVLGAVPFYYCDLVKILCLVHCMVLHAWCCVC